MYALTKDTNPSKYGTNLQINLNISQNIEECVCYIPRKEAKSEKIFYFVTGIGDCLNFYAAL